MTYKVLQDRCRNIAEAGDAHPDGTIARRVSVWTPSARPLEVQSRIGVDPADDTIRGTLFPRAVRAAGSNDTFEISLGQYRGIGVTIKTYAVPAGTLSVNGWASTPLGQVYQWTAGASISTIRTATWLWYPGQGTAVASDVVMRSDTKPPSRVFFSIVGTVGNWDYEATYELLA